MGIRNVVVGRVQSMNKLLEQLKKAQRKYYKELDSAEDLGDHERATDEFINTVKKLIEERR